MNAVAKTNDGREINIATLARMWNEEGLSAAQIGRVLGLTRMQVLGHVHRHRDVFKSRKKQPLYRRTNGRKPVPAQPKEKKERKATDIEKTDGRHFSAKGIHRARMEAAAREADEFKAGTAKLLQIHESDQDRMLTGKELHHLGVHECKWPLNNGHPFIFCASRAEEGNYCQHHTLRAYRPREAS
jgi:GcrA cell cycle regulator